MRHTFWSPSTRRSSRYSPRHTCGRCSGATNYCVLTAGPLGRLGLLLLWCPVSLVQVALVFSELFHSRPVTTGTQQGVVSSSPGPSIPTWLWAVWLPVVPLMPLSTSPSTTVSSLRLLVRFPSCRWRGALYIGSPEMLFSSRVRIYCATRDGTAHGQALFPHRPQGTHGTDAHTPHELHSGLSISCALGQQTFGACEEISADPEENYYFLLTLTEAVGSSDQCDPMPPLPCDVRSEV